MNASRSREMDEPIAVKNRDRDISNWKNASRRSIDSFRVAIFFTQVFVALSMFDTKKNNTQRRKVAPCVPS